MQDKDFKTELEYSHVAGDDEIFEAYYRKKFDRVLRIEKAESPEQQKLGIDKIIHQHGNRWITVDEKKRRKIYRDIAIEVVHCHKADRETWNDRPKTLDDALLRKPTKEGWIFKNNCDFLVYAIMPSRVIFLLPFKLLVVAVRRNWIEWGKHPKRFPIISSPNKGYWSVSIGVSSGVLIAALESEIEDTFDSKTFVGPEAVKYFVEPSGQISFSLLRNGKS